MSKLDTLQEALVAGLGGKVKTLDRAGQCFECRGHQRAMVLVRQILFWSWMIPYISASDVGGHPGT